MAQSLAELRESWGTISLIFSDALTELQSPERNEFRIEM